MDEHVASTTTATSECRVDDLVERLRAAEAALRRSEARFRALVQNAGDMVVVHQDGIFTYTSEGLTRTLGWSADELLGQPVASIVHPDDHATLHRRIGERKRGLPSDQPGRYRVRCKDGTWRTVETISTACSDDPDVPGIVVNARDVTATIGIEEAIRASEARHRALVEHLSDVIVVADADGRISYASPGIKGVVGHAVDDVVGGSIFDAIHPDDEQRARDQLARAVADGPGRYGPERFRYLRADGEWRHLEATGTNRLDDPAVGGLVFVLRDVTTQVEHEEQLRHLALHDPLTDLPNRTLATDRLRGALAAGRRQGTKTALLVIDLDGFKEVNDVHGHDAGDAVLVELAARMTKGRRAMDTIGRLGGDEFAIVLPAAGSAADVSAAAHRLVDRLRQPVHHRGATIQVGASVGIALAPTHGEDVDALFRTADAAMYRAKGSRLGVAVHGSTGSSEPES